MIKIQDFYKALSEKCIEISNDSFSDEEKIKVIGKSHSFIDDYNSWLSVLSEKPEYYILQIAIREYQTALLANVLGLYNLAFTGLRFFFERSLIAVMFSSKELDLRLWEKSERDTYWNEIIDNDAGIFSHRFSRAFFPDLKDECLHYKRMSEKVYRECSEFVHGNIISQKKVPETLIYHQDLSQEWHQKVVTIRSVIFFTFCLRYLNFLKPHQLSKIENCALDEFSHISPIRSIFGGVK